MAERIRKNDAGEFLGDSPVRLKKADYGIEGCYGIEPHIYWKKYQQVCTDDDGFDRRHIEENGEYKMEVVLPKDTLLIRYGSEMGHFTAPKGTPYESLALPYVKETMEFHEYRVIADSITVFCRVTRGRVGPYFDSEGGGIQYLHKSKIRELTGRMHVLEEVLT